MFKMLQFCVACFVYIHLLFVQFIQISCFLADNGGSENGNVINGLKEELENKNNEVCLENDDFYD